MGAIVRRERHGAEADLGLLALRLAVGGLLMGHGSQKLFGWFDGPGVAGFGGFLESMGYKPGKQWATLAGLSEFGGGALTALGLLHPLGPIATLGAMGVASVTVHGGKPIWAAKGGAELPLTNIAAAIALATIGPGQYSLDHALGIRLPKQVGMAAMCAVAAGVVVAKLDPGVLAQISGAAEDAKEAVGG
ncbi:MAG: DoxX family protein, partial [Thermomicrobiales bacterium]|nr:DoxX family protein [Thermomicrobiales bacterium]